VGRREGMGESRGGREWVWVWGRKFNPQPTHTCSLRSRIGYLIHGRFARARLQAEVSLDSRAV